MSAAERPGPVGLPLGARLHDAGARLSRRNLLAGALAALPALALLQACLAEVEWSEARDNSELSEAERARRRRLEQALSRHVQAQNDHDLERLMRTTAGDAEIILNGQVFDTPEAIRAHYVEFGMSREKGGLVDPQVKIHEGYFTDDAILTRGSIRGRHVGSVDGLPSTGLQVEMAYMAFFQFDRASRLLSKRMTLDRAALLGLPPLYL